MKIYGIDVSNHQGAINWQRTASELRRVNGGSNPGFALLRAGYSARHGKGGPPDRAAGRQNAGRPQVGLPDLL